VTRDRAIPAKGTNGRMAARQQRETHGEHERDDQLPAAIAVSRTNAGTRPSRKGQWRRDKILAATIRLVARNGGRGTSLAEIAGEAGVTQQGLLHYFSSKGALLHAALDVRDERDAVSRDPNWQGLEFLDAIVERIGGWRAEPEMVGMFTLLLVENLGEHAPLRGRLAERYELVRREYADAIRAAQASGVARLDVDPDLKAIEVIAFLNGLETSWLLNPSIPVEDVAHAWAGLQRAAMTAGLPERTLRSRQTEASEK
jgi:AcrR family transcriptional regulator